MTALETALRGIVGSDHLLSEPATTTWSVDGRSPRWVAAPGTEEEVSRLLALAAAERLAVIPVGGRTKLGWGNPPRGADLAIDLRRLDRLVEYEPGDLTVTLEAGVRLGALARVLERHGQFVPLDPPLASRATVGGVIATNASGPWRHRYGTVRDLLLGVTVVGADGTVTKGGGRVVKNVTGYDVPKLHVGALGSLGIVIAATLRVHPRPAAEATWVFGMPSPEAALEAALRLLDSPLLLQRLELVDGPTLTRLGVGCPHPAGLAVGIGSVPEAVRAQGAAVHAVCREGGGAALGLAGTDAAAFWAGVSDATLPEEPERSLTLRVGLLGTDLAKGFRLLESATHERGLALAATATLGVGTLRARLAGEGLADERLVARLREAVAGLGGALVVEHAPAALKPRLDVWGDAGPAFGVMRRLKAEFDPLGLLNPGRFVGRL